MKQVTLGGSRSLARRGRTRRRTRSPVLAVLLLVVCVLALGAIELAVLYAGPVSPPWQVVLFPVVGWAYLVAGAGGWESRPSNRLGALMIVGGLGWMGPGLSNAPVLALVDAGIYLAN